MDGKVTTKRMYTILLAVLPLAPITKKFVVYGGKTLSIWYHYDEEKPDAYVF